MTGSELHSVAEDLLRRALSRTVVPSKKVFFGGNVGAWIEGRRAGLQEALSLVIEAATMKDVDVKDEATHDRTR